MQKLPATLHTEATPRVSEHDIINHIDARHSSLIPPVRSACPPGERTRPGCSFPRPRGKLRAHGTHPNVPHAPPAPKPAPFRPRNVTRTTPPPNAWEANAGINNQVTKEQRERHFWAFNIFTAWVFRFQNFVSSFLCCSIASFRFSIIYPAPGKCALLAAIYTHTKN